MNRYTIPCTAEQTKKAVNLDAPLEIDEGKNTVLCKYKYYNTYKRCVIPTAEQMIGWLEEQESITAINIDYYVTGNSWACWIKFKEGILNKQDFGSRKEATLAAIDAALEHIGNLKQ